MPIEAMVIPSWQADRYSSIWSSCSSTAEAPREPSEASCSSFERRERTSANSAATNTPLTAISTNSRMRRTALIVYGLSQVVCRPDFGRPIGRTYFEGGRRRSLATSEGYRTPPRCLSRLRQWRVERLGVYRHPKTPHHQLCGAL